MVLNAVSPKTDCIITQALINRQDQYKYKIEYYENNKIRIRFLR